MATKKIRILLALAAVLTALALLSAAFRAGKRSNLLLVTLDTTRADRLGCYGYAEGLTPVLDALASAGTLFENAFASAPLTLPSHATMLTGLEPPEHGLKINGERRLPDSITTLAEVFQGRGYRTGAFIGAFVLARQFGLDQGFEVYDDRVAGQTDPQSRLGRHRPGAKVVDAALGWLKQNANRSFFCWVHLYDPHDPYDAHPEMFGERFERRSYDGEIAYTDVQVGRLVRFLEDRRIGPKTLVVIAGDHGESLGEHGELTHGNTLYNGALRVPLILWQPGRIPADRRLHTFVSLVDLYPTAIALTGCGRAKGFSGRSLVAVLKGREPEAAPLYAETDLPFLQFGWCPLRCILADPWKYTRTSKAELYNIREDPHERRNLAGRFPEVLAGLDQDLTEIEGGLAERDAPIARLSAGDRRDLTSLGYAAGLDSSRKPGDLARLPDVKDMIHLIDKANRVQELLTQGQNSIALALAEELVGKDPGNACMQLAHGTALGAAGSYHEATQVLSPIWNSKERFVPLDLRLLAASHLALCLHDTGDDAGAIAILRDAMALEPENARVHNDLAWLLAMRQDPQPGDREEAVRLAEEALRLVATETPRALDTLAAAYAAAGQFDDAVRTQRRALALVMSEPLGQAVLQYQERLALYERSMPYRDRP